MNEQIAVENFEKLVLASMQCGVIKDFATLDKLRDSIKCLKLFITTPKKENEQSS